MFSQLTVAARPRQVNLSDVFSNERSAVPSSLSDASIQLYKRNEANLSHILEVYVGWSYCQERIQLADARCCYIYVAMAVVHTFSKPHEISTFGDKQMSSSVTLEKMLCAHMSYSVAMIL